MQRIRELYAVDKQHRVHTVGVYKYDLGSLVYRLDDREMVEPLDEKWFLTQAGDVLARVSPPAGSLALEYDLGYFDRDQGRVEPGPNPFAPHTVLTMCPE